MVFKFSKLKIMINILVLFHIIAMCGFNAIILVSLMSIYYTVLNFRRIVKTDYKSKFLIVSGILVAFISVIVCKIKYDQSFAQGIVGIYFIFIYLSYFIFYDYFMLYDDGIKRVIRLILGAATLIAILEIIQSVFYPFFNVFEYTLRNGKVRIYEVELSFFAEIIAFSYLIFGQSTKKNKIQMGLMVTGLVFVSQSRGAFIVLCISGIIAIIRKYWKEATIRSLINNLFFLCLLIEGVYLFSKTSYWDFLFSFFDEIQAGMGSGATRLYELIYYFSELQKEPWFGLGIIRGGSVLADKIYRKDLWYYIEDCGLLGYIFQTGIVGTLWIIFVFASLLKKIRKLMKIKTTISKIIINSLSMLIIASLVGFLNANHIVSRTSILFFSILLAMADVYIKKELEIQDE